LYHTGTTEVCACRFAKELAPDTAHTRHAPVITMPRTRTCAYIAAVRCHPGATNFLRDSGTCWIHQAGRAHVAASGRHCLHRLSRPWAISTNGREGSAMEADAPRCGSGLMYLWSNFCRPCFRHLPLASYDIWPARLMDHAPRMRLHTGRVDSILSLYM
jgi:hypothetical protein